MTEDREKDLDAAYEFLDRACLTPTPDAVAQLVDAFLPALRIMCERVEGRIKVDSVNITFTYTKERNGQTVTVQGIP